MVLFLPDLKEFLEENDVSTKYIKNGMLYCRTGDRYSSFKIKVRDPEYTDEPYHIMKEGLSGNAWGEDFETPEDLCEFILEKQNK